MCTCDLTSYWYVLGSGTVQQVWRPEWISERKNSGAKLTMCIWFMWMKKSCFNVIAFLLCVIMFCDGHVCVWSGECMYTSPCMHVLYVYTCKHYSPLPPFTTNSTLAHSALPSHLWLTAGAWAGLVVLWHSDTSHLQEFYVSRKIVYIGESWLTFTQ